ncbi:MAG: ECF-type sigma factor [Gemmatimonadota bacterium]|jgi:RNA polymerase sigma factor (TIGR02999 family)|nr:ECF-type sigma factor [Gemmatimonadota bacterium]
MAASPRRDLTELLRGLDPASPCFGEVYAIVYEELRVLAYHQLRGERADHTLQPTALVHEVFLRLTDTATLDLQSRNHFFGVAARAMRQVLVDHARRRQAAKRGGDLNRVTLTTGIQDQTDQAADVLDLHNALEKLQSQDEPLARLVEMRFFTGLTLEEAADVLGVSRRTAAKNWSVARLWLKRELEGST